MISNGSATPEQLSILREVLDSYCAANRVSDEDERNHIATMIMDLFARGHTTLDEVTEALESIIRRNERRQA